MLLFSLHACFVTLNYMWTSVIGWRHRIIAKLMPPRQQTGWPSPSSGPQWTVVVHGVSAKCGLEIYCSLLLYFVEALRFCTIFIWVLNIELWILNIGFGSQWTTPPLIDLSQIGFMWEMNLLFERQWTRPPLIDLSPIAPSTMTVRHDWSVDSFSLYVYIYISESINLWSANFQLSSGLPLL